MFSTNTSSSTTSTTTSNLGTPAKDNPLTLSALKTPNPNPNPLNPSTPTPAFSFGTTPATTTTNPTATTATTTTATTTTTTTNIKKEQEILTSLLGKPLSDILGTWSAELSATSALFHAKASQIARLDTQLLEQSDKIYRLVMECETLTAQQQSMEGVLGFVEGQQRTLDGELDAFEQKLDQLIKSSGTQQQQQQQQSTSTSHTQYQPLQVSPYSVGSAEEARGRTYDLADQLSQELATLGDQINEMVEYVNQSWKFTDTSSDAQSTTTTTTLDAAQKKPSATNPVDLITKILNEHFNSLQWMDSSLTVLQQRLAEVKRYSDLTSVENRVMGKMAGSTRPGMNKW